MIHRLIYFPYLWTNVLFIRYIKKDKKRKEKKIISPLMAHGQFEKIKDHQNSQRRAWAINKYSFPPSYSSNITHRNFFWGHDIAHSIYWTNGLTPIPFHPHHHTPSLHIAFIQPFLAIYILCEFCHFYISYMPLSIN